MVVVVVTEEPQLLQECPINSSYLFQISREDFDHEARKLLSKDAGMIIIYYRSQGQCLNGTSYLFILV